VALFGPGIGEVDPDVGDAAGRKRLQEQRARIQAQQACIGCTGLRQAPGSALADLWVVLQAQPGVVGMAHGGLCQEVPQAGAQVQVQRSGGQQVAQRRGRQQARIDRRRGGHGASGW